MGQTGAIGWFFGVWVPQPLAGVNHKLLIMPHKASRRWSHKILNPIELLANIRALRSNTQYSVFCAEDDDRRSNGSLKLRQRMGGSYNI